MAGSTVPGEGGDNPVELNVTAMVDIIFCLILFFMCSFHFKQLQGRIDSWLPKDEGVNAGPPQASVLEEIRVVLAPGPTGTVTSLGAVQVSSWDELGRLLLASAADYEATGKRRDEVPVIVDAAPLVPWRDVMEVMNVCKANGLTKIQFAAPLPAGAAAPGP
jgi:biopolymer transport protein ExbD